MIIYNVTTQVNWKIHDAWLAWMKGEHIPEVLATGLFTHHRLLRLIDVEEAEGPTYAVQYFTSTREKYNLYIANDAKELREKTLQKWGDQIFAFRSLMEVVE
ncbi:MAG TPA: DUF4286 family protein [Chitinophagaceae bacterium]|nr:DUF4286 family protein [Chitinophagaceae bacterium]